MIATPVLFALLVAAPPAELDRVGSPYFLVEGTGQTEVLPLKETSAKISIAGVIARVRVTQVYQNEGRDPIEALYVFPGSTRSAVFGMRMKIADRTIEAKIEKREAAQQMYERAVEEGRTASLLEQHRPNVFSMRVGNILPGDRIEVVLDYTELLRPEEGVYELVYPTVVGPRYTSGQESSDTSWNQNPYTSRAGGPTYKWAVSVRLAAGLPVSGVSSPSHRISPRFEGRNIVQVETDDEAGGNRDFVLRYRLEGNAVETGLLLYEDPSNNGEKYFLLMAQPPKREVARAPVPREYIFVLDVSGSMNGFPLATAKTLLRGLLGGMKSEDRFNILFFSGGSSALAEKSISANPENLALALEMIDRHHGGGGTEILAALKRTLEMPRTPEMAATIAVLTDGYVMVESETYKLIRENLGNANLFAFGIGNSVNRAIIEGMARAGMGEPFYALTAEEAVVQAQKFQSYVEMPLLSNIQVNFGEFGAYDVEPRVLPDMFASRPAVMFGKYRGKAQGKIKLTGTDVNGKFESEVRLEDSAPSDDLVALKYLWARDRIARLSDDLALSPTTEGEKQITDLGLKHGLMTEFTSFVAIDSQVRNQGTKPKKVTQALPLPSGMSEGKLGKREAYGMGGLGLRGTGAGGSGHGTGAYGGLGATGRGKSDLNIKSGMPVVMGSLDKNIIRRVINKNMAKVKYCYEKSLQKNPLLEGKIVVNFTIAPDGTVTAVTAKETTLGDADTETCIMKVVQSMLFPKPVGGGAVIVNYPYVFKRSS